MTLSNIVVASAEQIADHYGFELADSHSKTPNGSYVPYGLAGVVNNASVVCADCATEEELRDDNDVGGPVFGDAEWDAPATCMDCGKVLCVRQLVYESNHPELFDELTE